MVDPSDDSLESLCDEISQRQFFPRGPRKIGSVVNDLLARSGYARMQSASGCQDAWNRAVGEKMACHCRVGNVRRGALEVTVRNSAIVQELTFINKKLVKKLQELAPDQKIREIRFRVGSIE